jgi:hypothetical protein
LGLHERIPCCIAALRAFGIGVSDMSKVLSLPNGSFPDFFNQPLAISGHPELVEECRSKGWGNKTLQLLAADLNMKLTDMIISIL